MKRCMLYWVCYGFHCVKRCAVLEVFVLGFHCLERYATLGCACHGFYHVEKCGGIFVMDKYMFGYVCCAVHHVEREAIHVLLGGGVGGGIIHTPYRKIL